MNRVRNPRPASTRPHARRPAGLGGIAATVAAIVAATVLLPVLALASQEAAEEPAAAATPETEAAALAETDDGRLETFLAAAANAVGVVTADLDRDDAVRALRQVELDPLALRLDRLQAEQRAALTAAEAEGARYQAYRDVAAAWARVREAELQVTLASAARDLAERNLDVARIRRDRGGATELDVDEAATELLDAERGLAAARDGAALARADLAGMTGLPAAAPLTLEREALNGIEVPADEALEDAAERVPTLLRTRQGAALAALGRELLDPSFASRRQIEAAQLQLEQARAGATEAERGVRLQLQALANALATAIEGDRIAQEALRSARARDDVERRRLEAGLISELAYEAARLATLQAEVRAVQAEHALVDALLALQAGALLPIEGWHGF